MSFVEKKIYVSESKFNELEHSYSGGSISDNGTVRKIVTLKNEKYVCVAIYHLSEKYLEAVKSVPLTAYNEKIQPLKYGEYTQAVYAGKRERGYYGMQVRHKNEWWVLTGEILKVRSNDTGKQLDLF